MLVRCLYASRAKGVLDDTVLETILRQSRRNNPKHGITGLLCCANDVFVQVLEGGRAEVSRLFGTITRDERNHDVQLLIYDEIAERHFSNWTMGHVTMSSLNPALLLRYSEKAELNPFNCPGAVTMALLLEIAASGSIVSRTT